MEDNKETVVKECNICKKETTHNVEVDMNNDRVETCQECGHFLKYPLD